MGVIRDLTVAVGSLQEQVNELKQIAAEHADAINEEREPGWKALFRKPGKKSVRKPKAPSGSGLTVIGG